jgi:hypothetical protein
MMATGIARIITTVARRGFVTVMEIITVRFVAHGIIRISARLFLIFKAR